MDDLHWVSRYATNIYKCMILAGLTIRDISERSGISYSALINLRNRDFSNVSIDTLSRLDNALNDYIDSEENTTE